jgi:hypothetical protein
MRTSTAPGHLSQLIADRLRRRQRRRRFTPVTWMSIGAGDTEVQIWLTMSADSK